MKKIILFLCLIVSSTLFSQTLLLEENFDYTVGDLLTTHGWLQSGSTATNPLTVTAPGLTYPNYPSTVGNASTLTTSGQDDYTSFSSTTSGSVYLSFLLNVQTAKSGGDYFIAISPSNGQTNYYCRTYIKSSGAGYLLGLTKSNETPVVYGTTVLSFNTTYLVVCKHSFVAGTTTDDIESIYVFASPTIPATEPSLPSIPEVGPYTNGTKTDPTSLGYITLRQGSATTAAGLRIDGIRVSDSWFVLLTSPPVATSATNVVAISFDANWNAVSGASGYKLDVATDIGFTNILAAYNNLDVGNAVTKTVTGLTAGVTYYYRVRAYNSASESGLNSNTKANVEITLAGIEAGTLAYTELDPATQITATSTVAANLTNLDGAIVQITSNYQNGADVLGFTDANGITGVWDASTGTMTLAGAATVANYQTALRSVTYQNTSQNPSTSQRTVSFTVIGASLINSNTITRNISVAAVNNAPALAGIEVANLNYTEGEGAKQITSSLTVSDVDNTALQSAVVQVTSNYVNGEDVLTFTNQNGIAGTWTAGTGTLNLTGASSVANYQTALQSIGYQNTSQNPSTAVRTVSITVNDGALNSNTPARNINVTAVNNPPTLSSIEMSPLIYPTGNPAVVITQTIVLNDPDNVNIASAEVKIAGHYQNGNDVLAFVDANGITGTWDVSTGKMTLTGVTTIANYQTALRSVTYQHTEGASPDKYSRTITFKTNDGTAYGNTVSRDINLGNTPPVLAGIESTPLEFKQGEAPKTVTGGITITDEGIPNLQNATIWISNNYKNGDDVLSFINQNGIVGTWYPTQGVLVLNLGSSVSNYEAALRNVTYNNISNNPGTLPKTVSFKVSDMYMESNVVTRTINITPVYTVALVTNPTNGGTTTGVGTFDPGTSVTVTATPNTGYIFVNWTEGETEVSTSATYTFTINSSRTLTANFALTQCTVTTSSSPTDGGTTSGGGTFDYGTSVTVTATPNVGYAFLNWTSGGTVVSTSQNYTFTVSGIYNLVANFMMLPVLTVTPNFVTVGPSSGTASFNVTNTGGGTMDWTAVSDIFWIKIKTGASGTNGGTINVTYDHNNSALRVGTITITATGVNGSPKIVEMRQDEPVTFVENLNLGIPDDFRLEQNYPNPFNPSTKIRYGLPKESNVVLTVYNILGEEVAKLVNDVQSAGYYEANFAATNLSSGIYVYRISAGSFTQIRKMLLIK